MYFFVYLPLIVRGKTDITNTKHKIMKKILQIKRALPTALLVLLLSLVGKVNAQDFTDGNLNYAINSNGTSVTVTGYLWEGDLVIPESVTYEGASYAVTAIGDYAFAQYNGYDLGDLVIPNSVVTIGEGAFSNACRFTGLIIGNAVTSIGVGAFEFCYDFAGPLVIPNSVVTIGSSAFYGCYGFTELTIGNSVTTIGDNAFGGYSSFEGNLVIPNSITTLGEGAFSGCSGFTGMLSIPNSITTIEDWTFQGCSGFTGLSISNSVTAIGNYAFFGCHGFTGNLSIPATVTSIGEMAFYYCNGFDGDLVISNSVTTIGNGAFGGCEGFTGTLTIPSSVAFIDGNAFVGCDGIDHVTVDAGNTVYDSRNNCNGIIETANNKLIAGFTNTTIPNTVVSIGYYAFQESGFSSIVIPNSVVEIETGAFSFCNALNAVVIPSSVTSIGERVFAGCNRLEQITVEAENHVYDSRDNCNAIVESGTNLLISGCKNTVIPNTVTTIGSQAFNWCDLTSIVIPMSVTRIDDEAFCNSYLTGDLVIPNSVVSIGNYAFYGCYDLNGSLTLGNSLTEIGGNAFAECYHLKTVISLANTPPALQSEAFGWEVLDQLVVSCGNNEAYEASDWVDYFNAIEEDCNTYSITVENSTGGVISTSVSSVLLGEEVSVSHIAESGYELNSLVVCKANDATMIVPCTNDLFVMPNFDVVVKPMFVYTSVDENDCVAVSVYPNPTFGNVKVEAENLRHVRVLNELGQQLYDGFPEGDEFEYYFSGYEAGIYLILIEAASGISTKRVVLTK